jgi:lipopolysaccharide/colanic/teichoic acid biosynthesis glycosyltransferase
LFFGRILIYKILKSFGVKGYNHVNTIIIADTFSLPFIENLFSKKELGYNVVVIFTESVLIKHKFENVAIILPEKFLGILNDLIKVDFIDEVLYLKEKPEASNVREILRACEDLGVTLRLKSKDPKVYLSSAVNTDIADGKFLSFINIPNNSYAMAIKKTMDINIALLMIVVLFPVLIILSALIKLTSRGPIISTYIKTGWRGQLIKVYRFRTMIANDEQISISQESEMKIYSPEFEIDKDSRVTTVGRFLIMSGLDQLPQLFNILKGEIPIIAHRHPLQSEVLNGPQHS